MTLRGLSGTNHYKFTDRRRNRMKRIAVVEDELFMREELSDILRRLYGLGNHGI